MRLPKGKLAKCVLLSLVCFVCYGNTIPHDYAYDDSVVITENRFTQEGLAGIPDIFQKSTFAGSYENVPILARYRPLSLATFAIEHEFFGPDPHVGHFNNVLLFALTAGAVYLLLAKVFSPSKGKPRLLDFPFLAALLFAVHPIHTEVVANLKGRDEILALAGSASGTLFVLEYLDSRRLLHWALSLALFLVGLFSKENGITFLAIVPLTVFYYQRKRRTRYVYSLLPVLIASAIFLGVRGLVLRHAGPPPPVDILTEPFAYASSSARFATILATFGWYAKLLFFPHPLTIDYSPYHVKLASWAHVAVWLSLAAYLAMAGYAAWKLSRRSVVAYGILFYLITFSIVSNLAFSVGTFMSERFMFAPSVGFAVVIARLLSNKRWPLKKYRNLVVPAISLAFAGKTLSRNQAWKDDFTLFTTDVETSKDSIKANLAASVIFLQESHKTDSPTLSAEYRAKALRYSTKAVSIYQENVDPIHLKGTSYTNALMLLGNAYSENGRLDEALRCYREIIASVSDRDALCDAIQATINKSDDVDFRLKSYLEFWNLVPGNFGFNYHLGLLYGKEKSNLAKAIQYFGKAVEIKPSDVNALRGLSRAYKLSKDYERAAFYLEKIVEQNPDSLPFLEALRDLYRLTGNQAKEQEVLKRMEGLEPSQDR